MPSLRQISLPARWSWLALLCSWAGMPGAASAQVCQDSLRWISGSTQVVDGSTASGQAWISSNPCPQGPTCVQYHSIPGSLTYEQLIYEGSYTFKGELGFYFPATGGSATCTLDQPPLPSCLRCSGSFSLDFKSSQGLIEGHAYRMPSMEPLAPYQIYAVSNGQGFPTVSQTTPDPGFFTFRPAGSPNNWGLPLNATPGPRSYRVGAWNAPPEWWVPATIDSNKKEHVDLVWYDPAFEPPPRCNTCQSPPKTPDPFATASRSAGPDATPIGPSCRVGNPVSVTTGNVDVDQTDATVPGLGLGLQFTRSYNSHNISAGRFGVFGPGWSHSYEKRLEFPAANVIRLRDSKGQPWFYQDGDVNGVFLPSVPFTAENWIEKESATVYVRRFRRGGSERYEVSGSTALLTTLTDAAGNATVLVYTSGQLTSIADPGGRQVTLAYTGSQIQTLTGPAGLIATFMYTTSVLGSVLHTVTYADGDGDSQADGAYTFAYDASGRLHTVTDGAGVILETHLYDASGRAIETKVSGDVEKYLLDYSQPNKTLVTDSLGNVTTYEWADIWGSRRITKITGPCAGCGGGGGDSQEWTYDRRGRVQTHKDGNGHVTSYEYNLDGGIEEGEDPGDNVLRIVRPAPSLDGSSSPHVTQFSYHPDGRMATRIDPNGGSTSWAYGASGPTTITTSGVNSVTTISYTPQGKVHTVIDPVGRQTEMHHTTQGDLEWTRDHLLHQTWFEHDAMGRLEKRILPATTPANDTPRTSFDTLGRMWKITNPNSTFWRHWYDGGGRRTRTQDPELRETHFSYDDYGRLEQVEDAAGGETGYQYTLMSKLSSLTDAKSQTTVFEYDGHHRVRRITYPSQAKPVPFEEFTYDAAGHLLTRRDRKGVTSVHAYDALGRLTSTTYLVGLAEVVGPSYGYDANGDLGYMTSASNTADQLTLDYDLAGRLLSESSSRNASTVSYVYNLAGQRTTLRRNGTDFATYAYLADGQLDTITRSGAVFDFNYDAAHRRQSVSFPNGTTTEYGYDLLSRLSLIRLRKGATVHHEITYESDDLENRTARTQDGTRLEYGYDDLLRLTTVDKTLPTPAARQEEYTYDPVGNRLSALGIAGPWTYNERNELLSYNGINFGYDANGNMTSRSGSPARSFGWDYEDRLINVLDNGVSVASHEYDPLGRRVATTTAGVQRLFTYDGEDILREEPGRGEATFYVHGPGIDEPLARETGITRSFTHADGLGSIVKTTNGQGNVADSLAYDSFGRLTGSPSRYAFTGREWDSGTGIYYYRARYYDPILGRFLSEDPVGAGLSPHLYRYVDNRPVSMVDPTGEMLGPVCQAALWGWYGLVTKNTSRFKNPGQDVGNQKMHCWLACETNRTCYSLLYPLAPDLFQHGLEAVGGFKLDWDQDNRAGLWGIWYSYDVSRTCDEICDSLPVPCN